MFVNCITQFVYRIYIYRIYILCFMCTFSQIKWKVVVLIKKEVYMWYKNANWTFNRTLKGYYLAPVASCFGV
jgi:hypothetical protein